MKFVFELNTNFKTGSGKPTINFLCEHCHNIGVFTLVHWFWESNIDKTDAHKALEIFVDMINNNDFSFISPSKHKSLEQRVKIFKQHICLCDSKIVNINYLQGVNRAKKILELGLLQND